MSACVVSFVDLDGLRHTVELEADSLYEAAVLAIRTIKLHNCEPAANSSLEIEVRYRIMVQIPGDALRIEAPVIYAEFKRGGKSQDVLLSYTHTLLPNFAIGPL